MRKAACSLTGREAGEKLAPRECVIVTQHKQRRSRKQLPDLGCPCSKLFSLFTLCVSHVNRISGWISVANLNIHVFKRLDLKI